MFIDSFPSPLGWFTVVVDGAGGVVAVRLAPEPAGPGGLDLPKELPLPTPDRECTRAAREQLLQYARGERVEFDLPLAIRGTPFQLSAWGALLAIPFGRTRSYKDQACALGKPEASRPVGQANSRNRLAVVVPCHRVIATGGDLGGYAGGLDLKRRLLEHEQRVLERLGAPERGSSGQGNESVGALEHGASGVAPV